MITPETADAPKTPSPPPAAADSSKELAALKRKVAELEKALAGKTTVACDAAACSTDVCLLYIYCTDYIYRHVYIEIYIL